MSPCTSLKFKQPVTKPNLLPLSFFLSVCLCSPSYEEWEKSRSPTLSVSLWLTLWGHKCRNFLVRLSEYFYEHTHDGGSFDSAERQSLKREREKRGKNESWLKEASILRGFKLSLHLNFARNDKASSPLSHTLRTFCNQCCRYFFKY